jgi:hypothetical protein
MVLVSRIPFRVSSPTFRQAIRETVRPDANPLRFRRCRRARKGPRFGIKYVAKGRIGRSIGRSGSVLTVWIVEGDDPPRLVTAYPDEES